MSYDIRCFQQGKEKALVGAFSELRKGSLTALHRTLKESGISECYAQVGLGDMVRCWPYSQQMFSCLASERDHRPCCAQRGLPASCLGLCSSEGMAVERADLQYLSCLQYMPG